MREEELVKSALEARERAYTPYSHFKVGAALLTAEGEVIQGCNIENASFSVTNCAERTAFFKAVSEGEREFSAIAVVGGYELDFKDYFAPCGVCRQVMAEFCDMSTFKVILGKNGGEFRVFTLKEILPFGISPQNLKDRTEKDA